MSAPAEEPAAGPAPPLTIHVVSHTHWDREWYLPFELFRVKLVRLIDRLLGILVADPGYAYFTLDGQTVVLEDYLEVRPERAAELRGYIEQGRVLVGPWYVLPDEFLVSGEALIRNFLRGGQIAAGFGGGMPVGYIPDPFGHISQMPQILRGFGMDWAVFWRGFGADVPGAEFWWQGPDGARVLGTRLLSGYANGLPLSFSLAAARRQVAWLREAQAPQTISGALLALNGDDHMAPGPDLPAILDTLNAELAEENVRLVHSTLPAYRAHIAAELDGSAVPTHTGEFREAQHAFLLPGVLSTRMWIKQANYAAETLLERWVEPWEAMRWALDEATGRQDPDVSREIDSAAGLRGLAWKYLLRNQPHDSICGCSVDAVHDEMKTRYASITQLGDALRDEALLGVCRCIHTGSADSPGQQAVVVFNPLRATRTDEAHVAVEATASLHTFRLLDDTGAEVPYEIVERRTREVASFDLDPLTLETALAMGADGRVMDMVVLDIFMRRGQEPGVIEVDITIADKGEPNLLAVQTAADAARRLAATGQARIFRLRGRHTGQVVARFVARDVPGMGYRTYTLSPRDSALDAPLDDGIAATLDGAGAAHSESDPMPPPAALYQPPAATVEPDPPDAEGLTRLHPALMTVDGSEPAGKHAIENEFLRVECDAATGALRVIDHEAGVVVRRGNVFVDSGDAGDAYNYCPPPHDGVVRGFEGAPRVESRRDALGGLIVIEGELALPAWLSEDRASRSAAIARCAVRSVIRVLDGVRRVDIATTLDNRAGDHRLRVLFETPFTTDYSEAEGAFDVVRRPAGPLPGSESWPERGVATYPQKSFVAVGDGAAGALLANRGLPEFEVAPAEGGATIALTLLRCVGWLSRDDLATRPGHAGPGLPAPGGQTFGVHTFEYAIAPFAGDWLQARAYEVAHSFATPLRAVTDSLHDGPLPGADSLIGVEPPALVVSALKRSEDGAALILRAWNIGREPVTARIRVPLFVQGAARVRVDEQPAEAGAASLAWSESDSAILEAPVGAREILTIRLEL